MIGKTWRYVNKKGGPDLRFKDNPQIPLYRYGQIDISCGAWQVRLCLSRPRAADEFATAIRSALSGKEYDTEKNGTEIPPKTGRPSAFSDPSTHRPPKKCDNRGTACG